MPSNTQLHHFEEHSITSFPSFFSCNSFLSIPLLSIFFMSHQAITFVLPLTHMNKFWIPTSLKISFQILLLLVFVWALISHFIFITCLLLHICEIHTVISQLRSELFWVLNSFPNLFQWMSVYYLKLCHYHFLLHSFQFIIHWLLHRLILCNQNLLQ